MAATTAATAGCAALNLLTDGQATHSNAKAAAAGRCIEPFTTTTTAAISCWCQDMLYQVEPQLLLQHRCHYCFTT
jgi:hypothetical protein